MQDRIEQFKESCHTRGVKVTHQRLEIYREVASSSEHPDAETVYKGVRKRMPTISLDTVYRTLWFLLDLGLINTLGGNRERTRFDANLNQHHHFVCERCGKTSDFFSEEFNNLVPPEVVTSFGEAQATHVEIRGICKQCM